MPPEGIKNTKNTMFISFQFTLDNKHLSGIIHIDLKLQNSSSTADIWEPSDHQRAEQFIKPAAKALI